ncbi:histidine phosphatase family protein [Acinetobacter sp. CFCC 10889]|uniref:histidine phosphatase family protein n=1 Tax=Acinetobacter sp. CFCC 10889 TaxID=1775557 RepID=UPI000DCFDEDC|nr:histidine phosphatase family protein [Acinetobacter sp. CFCC 10889]
MKLKIDLLRHGETTLSHTLRGSTDDALTEQGQMQMQTAIQDFLDQSSQPVPWQAIYSSPLQRCQSFAENLSEKYAKKLLIEPDLQEIHFGDWEAKPTQWIYENFPEQLNQFWQTPTQYAPPNAETMQQFHMRICHALENIQHNMQQQHWQRVLLVTHGGVIKLLKCLAAQKSLDELLTMSAELGTLHRFELDVEQQKIHYLSNDLRLSNLKTEEF